MEDGETLSGWALACGSRAAATRLGRIWTVALAQGDGDRGCEEGGG